MCHSEWLLRENINQLKQLMSDQNLQLLPDYEQRIAVLLELGFIDEDARVELKGKVACEVGSPCENLCCQLIFLDPFSRRINSYGAYTRECSRRLRA